jgi:site-specific DNA-methyltransferase (adenine-specific)
MKEYNMYKLIHGDCIEEMQKLESGSIDLVLTDPPYGMSFRSNYRKEKYGSIENDNSLKWLPLFLDRTVKTMSKDSAFFGFCSFHNIDTFKQEIQKRLKVKNILVWEKNNTSMGDLRGDFAPKVEFVVFATLGRPLIRGKRDPNIFRFAKTGNVYHSTEKPVDMLEYLMSKFSDPGQTVCDPFMGSGSTCIACINTGRNFIGIEKDEEIFNTAKKRIEDFVFDKKLELKL